MRISLNESGWTFRGHWPYTPLFGSSMETGVPMGAVTDWMPAQVPGSVVHDLLLNGVVQNPYFDRNSLQYEWISNRWWVYRKRFSIDPALRNHHLALVLEGVDYRCHIFVNSVKMCEHEGMFEPIRIELGEEIRYGAAEENLLEVCIESAPDEMSQIGHTSRVHTQTSRFGYKWDWSTRMVHAGIWQDVYLEATIGARIRDLQVTTDLNDGNGIVRVHLGIERKRPLPLYAEVLLTSQGNEVAAGMIRVPMEFDSGTEVLIVRDPSVWWPSGYGEPFLYDLRIRLIEKDATCDERTLRIGIRSLRYETNEDATNALPYVVRINGKRIYIKGMNLAPLEHWLGSVGEVEYRSVIEQIVGIHANLVRIWGGGVTEKEIFYQLCDENGILVWQEFNQSSSGIDNIPPEDEGFLKLLLRNATATVLGRRNHVCLAFWNAGNELTDGARVPVTYENPSVAILKGMVDRLDPIHLFLPSSASGPLEFLDVSPAAKGKNHDVHGPWQYQGLKRHYEMYNLSDSLFHSEFGVDSMTNSDAARKFLSEDNIRVTDARKNLAWRHHGEWWDTTERDRGIFGQPESFDRMVLCSQFIQADGLRYAVEANRRRAFKNSGSIIWQLNEPWPNLFGTNLVDYYGRRKPGFYWVRRGYAGRAVSLKHDGIVCEDGSVFSGEVWVADDHASYRGKVHCRVLDLFANPIAEWCYDSDSNDRHSVMAGKIEFAIKGVPGGFFLVEISLEDPGTENQYLFSCMPEPSFEGLFDPRLKTRVSAEWTDCGIRICNEGTIAALFVRTHVPQAQMEDDGFNLLPGQMRVLLCSPFDRETPITIDWLNR